MHGCAKKINDTFAVGDISVVKPAVGLRDRRIEHKNLRWHAVVIESGLSANWIIHRHLRFRACAGWRILMAVKTTAAKEAINGRLF